MNEAEPNAAETEMSNSPMHRDSMQNVDLDSMKGNLIRTRDITGGNIYTMNEADDEGWDPDMRYNEVGADWNEIGEIEDIILSKDGQMIGIVGEVGGFLDIGDKHVLISIDDVNLVPVDDKTYAFVTRLNEEQLEELPEVDEGFWD
ncbi:PRC-barrel domain containing protein [Sulfitobacter sp. BDSS02]|nr:PRC-barrel domain containing protein [Sulfitobacter sp. BDSS02]MBR9848860.1 PRC-barrel domain containing protein [Paracoccaceae bacterium]